MIIPKGTLIPIGGAEDKGTDLVEGSTKKQQLNFFDLGILKSVLNEIGKENPNIILITTASQIPDEVAENYLDAFKKLDCTNVTHLRIRNRDEVDTAETLAAIKSCDGLMISGGNQMRLTTIYGGSEFLDIIHSRYKEEEGFVIAGTSAGAMAMSSTMIAEGSASTAHKKGAVKLTVGWGLIRKLIIDSHFIKRGRFTRLAQAVGSNPGSIGIGLGEDTGVIIKNANDMEIIGSGSVTLIDGYDVRHNNIADISQGKTVSIENLKVHIMERGNKYFLKERTFSAEVNELV
jgi:cyanophycinase